MDQFESLNHTKWDCKYHVVFIPKYRRRTLYGDLKRHLGPVFRQLAEQRESRVGKSAIHLARVYGERKRGFVGQSFWARGYFVSTVGRDETVIREYIKNQESEDQKLEQLNLWR